MNTEAIISIVKSNFGGYESISLANDDVENLLSVVRIRKASHDKLVEALETIRDRPYYGDSDYNQKIARKALKEAEKIT